MALEIYVNIGEDDIAREESGADYVKLNLLNDKLIFSAGSDNVKNGEPIPTTQQLNSAALLIKTSDVECPHFFLADASDVKLKEIHNAGNQDKRYVFCFAFDTPTASEPILEIWDDEDLDSIDNYCLGQGVADSSFFRGRTTTAGLPAWKRLAGSSEGYFLWLNDEAGAIPPEGKDLYANIRITIPANFENAKAEAPVFAIKYTTN